MSDVYLIIYHDAMNAANAARARGDMQMAKHAKESCEAARDGLRRIERSEKRYRLACMILLTTLIGVITQAVIRAGL